MKIRKFKMTKKIHKILATIINNKYNRKILILRNNKIKKMILKNK